MHHIEKFDGGLVRLYRHFAFRVAPVPPFAITAVSDELPLVYNQVGAQGPGVGNAGRFRIFFLVNYSPI